MIPHLCTTNEYYMLSHPDLHLGNIFVDENYKISSVIDWGSASSGPITELLATPGLGGSAVSPSEKLVSAFRSGFHLPEHLFTKRTWERANMMWYFSRLVCLLSTQDYKLFSALYKLVYKTDVEEPIIPELLHRLATQKDNEHLLAMLRADDYTASELEQEEAAAFGCSKTDTGGSRAVAQSRSREEDHGRCRDQPELSCKLEAMEMN